MLNAENMPGDDSLLPSIELGACMFLPYRTTNLSYIPYSAPSGELSGQGAELLVRFHTSTRDRPQYTIRTHGDCDMIIALLGPDNYTNVIKSVLNS